jgi:hypothetical protein
MEPLTLILSLALGAAALALIIYPLWQQTRPEAIFQVDRSGQTFEEYQARYQAVLAAIKDLMFDYEMGKVTTEDYELLLQRSKLEAAEIRHHLDRLSQNTSVETDPALDAEIERLVSQFKRGHANGHKTLRREIEAEIESLKTISFDQELAGSTCPHCGKTYQAGDAFCTGCGQALPDPEAEASKTTCPECGHPFEAGDAFCAKCGTPLTEDVAA